MRIHLLSDLHNEFGKPHAPQVLDADVTILAGDIDVKGRGVAWAKSAFPGVVLYVPGNHEYYGSNVQRTLAKMREEADDRVRVLDRDVVVIDGVRFLGATAWTDLKSTGNPPLAAWDARQRMNDYKKIRHTEAFRKWTPEAAMQESVLTRAWLRDQLALPFEGKTVVITHHAPTPKSIEDHPSSGTHLDASYVNRWEEELFGDGLLWVHGHTHHAVDFELMGTRVVSNPKGYPGEDVEGFNPGLVLDF